MKYLKKILYAEDHPDIREMYALVMRSITNREVDECCSGAEAIELLKEHAGKYALVVSDQNMKNGSGEDIFKYLVASGVSIPFILMSGDDINDVSGFKNFKKLNRNNKVLVKPVKKQDFDEGLQFLNEIEKDKEAIEEILEHELEFVPVKLSILYRAKNTPNDIYIRLKEDKFVLVYKAGQALDVEDVAKYERRNLRYIYVKKEEFSGFLDTFLQLVTDLITRESQGVSADSIVFHYEAHELIHKQLVNIGIDQATFDIAKKIIHSCVEQMSNEGQLKELLLKMVSSGEFLYEHSLMCSYLIFLMLDEVGEASKEKVYDLTMAAMFHDVSFVSSDELKSLELRDNLTIKETKKEYPNFFDHPYDSAAFLHEFKEISQDVNTIIVQHHELPDASGFPKGLKANEVDPLAAFFITAHYFNIECLRKDFNRNSQFEAIQKMNGLFDKGHYTRPFNALKKLFKIV